MLSPLYPVDKGLLLNYTNSINMNGKELRSIRNRLKLTQQELAKRVGVAPNTIARWERDEMRINEPAARFVKSIYAAEKSKAK